jgi:ppGpp synthetase/RelA/SpoT-type nucleotidyltranferase
MTFDEYEKRYAVLYAEYANVVKFILEKAIDEASDVPRPQSIQSRAKESGSLKRKLIERGLLESDAIETEIKDFAGARLIFYTNTDVDRFLNSRLIPKNFAIDYDATKIHHPVKENEGLRYQAIHYTVGLSDERLVLPEYAKFKGIRCEIQIQTILNHAWSETSHDIIYKGKSGDGFGSKAMASIRKRFDQIMDKYLLPAGYEFQRVQQDYERFQQGKALFDRGAIQIIRDAKNNNERHDFLVALKDRVLPNYDDIPAVYRDVSEALIEAAKTARTTPVEPVKTVFGNLEGKTAAKVLKVVVDIFNMLRYVDVERTFLALCDLFEIETDSESQKHILDTAKNLSHYDLDVWRQVGPQVQLALVETIESFRPERRVALRSLLIAVWSELLASDLRGTSWSAEAVTLSRGALPTSAELRTVREKALSGLFDIFGQSTSDTQRREVISALRHATNVPTSVPYSDEFLAMSLSDAKRIVDFLAQHSAQQSYEVLEHIEHNFLWDYQRARALAADELDKRGCCSIAQDLMSSIEVFRDSANSNEQFVRYKVLIGFEGVFPPAWNDDEFEFDGADKYRRERMGEYVAEISEAKEDEWYRFVERCAATKSDDLATFPVFRDFLHDLAQTKPAIAARFLKRANDDLLNFLPSFLDGLRSSGSSKEYDAAVAHFMATQTRLGELALHFRNAGSATDATIEELLGKAITTSNAVAVIQCLVLVIEKGEQATGALIDNVFTPALQYLIAQGDARWVRAASFLKQGKSFFAGRTSTQIEQVLKSLLSLSRLEHHAERILGWLAEKAPVAVWGFFGRRLSDPLESDGLRYEAVPYQFHGLEKILGSDADLGISIVRGWHHTNASLFRYRGGRLLKAVFPSLPEKFVEGLERVASDGTDEDIEFILGILHNFEGEVALHPTLQGLICRIPESDERLTEIEIILRHTGMVGGAFGLVEAYRQKKEEVASWLDDSRPRVEAFASSYRRKLDQLIASEQRSAEQRKEQRKRDFPDDDD